jgi:asparagine synthetase B (glutamine-hydrolysing)
VAFKKSGWIGVIEEMETDLKRICNRNLGRDDRCLSDNGKEVRFPFLDEDLISHLVSLPINFKCYPDNPIGDKHLLRNLVRNLLQLPLAASYSKRAMQFGAKTAKMFDSNESGTDLL